MSGQSIRFTNRATVIMALAGSAIGLGNIWRFPYLVGQNGGGAFVVIYIVASLLLSLPIFFAEAAIGRSTRANCRHAIGKLVPGWPGVLLGWMTIITPLWVASYYSVVGGWSLHYFFRACVLDFVRIPPEALRGSFDAFTSRPVTPLLCHFGFLAAALCIVALGVKTGIERFSKYAIPALFVLIVVIAAYSLSLPGASAGVRYLAFPDFSKVTSHTVLAALGQSFYSMSLGVGIVMTYSSYVEDDENLLLTGFGTAVSDLLFAYLAGLAVMPAVFAAGINPGSGPGLIFDSIPYVFAQMGQRMPVVSSIAALTFFLAVLFAALTSAISLVEVGVAYLVERYDMRRPWACAIIFAGCGLAGALCALSCGPLASLKVFGSSIFDFADKFACNVLMVLGGLICVSLGGWVLPREMLYAQLTGGGTLRMGVKLFPLVLFLMRYVSPIGIIVLALANFFL